ncbi:hypothetical protein OESDEN_01023 [Oesophagostomum dentatum]|uniref:DUF1758 domain-containing protein n=1 Tax=Oesophagostomum dentatum TaxID=61180 RepID=A0A0B1TS63_OESDE|nr:hypothetical protein OESDEN_01023 [Oesophagostomum dentatum]
MKKLRSKRRTTTMDESSAALKQCVLPIPTAMIFNEDEMDYQPVNLLLDSGAQRSFIKSELSTVLKLEAISSVSFITSGMGEAREMFNSDEVRITLKGLRSFKKLKKLRVHTKGKLITSLDTAQLSHDDLKFISARGLKIAQQTQSRTSISPDILIGQDLLSSIIDHSSPALTLPSGLMLTPTIFGYTISGTSTLTSDTAITEAEEGIQAAATTIVTSMNNPQSRYQTETGISRTDQCHTRTKATGRKKDNNAQSGRFPREALQSPET